MFNTLLNYEDLKAVSKLQLTVVYVHVLDHVYVDGLARRVVVDTGAFPLGELADPCDPFT